MAGLKVMVMANANKAAESQKGTQLADSRARVSRTSKMGDSC